jgi:16S rRNA (cytosine967-C5)-methyltransferase
MLRYGHLNTAISFVEKYKPAVPLAGWLKEQFKKDKKYGSRDRKYISHAVYCYFRVANAMPSADVAQKINAGLFLVNSNLPNIFAEINLPWHNFLTENPNCTLAEKVSFLNTQHVLVETNSIFKFGYLLSEGLSELDVAGTYLQQSNTFFRVRPMADIKNVEVKLEELDAWQVDGNCYAIENNKPIDKTFTINKEVVIQDWSSQNVSQYFPDLNQQKIGIWDVCAGAGGKTLLAIDHYQKADNSVNVFGTDIRASIIENYKLRMKEAGVKSFNTSVKDITLSSYNDTTKKFELAICDVPCTGSGTWGRTPEAHFYFTPETIRPLTTTQFLVLNNTVKQMQPGTFVLYITCSIFKQENEEIVTRLIESNNRVKLVKSGIINGTPHKADTMYAALIEVVG